ncbi:MAG: hypothetical protein V4543_07240 [Bacteroidota bacterium]
MVPSKEENIDYIVTFGNKASSIFGDDDYVQTYFFSVPINQTSPVFIRIFDADCGGKHDQINGPDYDSKTRFSVYGGNGAYSNKDARNINPVGNFKSGHLLESKVFGKNPLADNVWTTLGPFNPKEAEFDKDLNANVFKIVVEGISGDDGNTYRFFLSNSATRNQAIEGGNAFAYEICFRLMNEPNEAAHFYPFIDKNVVAIKQHNFDFDSDGFIRLTSVAKKEHALEGSADGQWMESTTPITEEEQNTSIDIHFMKKTNRSNDMVFYTTNQYNESIPFFSVPIGGIPKYRYKVNVEYKF